MKEKNQIGQVISYERCRAGLTINQLCRGLCSHTFLIRLESGDRFCEKILADALLQRLGVSADKFVHVMDPDAQDWLILRENLMDAVKKKEDRKAIFLMKNYQAMAVEKSGLHRQFLLFWQVMMELGKGREYPVILDILQRAWEFSMRGIPIEKFDEQNLTLMEFNLVMMYYHIRENCDSRKESIAGYERLLGYLETHADEEDSVKLYPQIAYRIVELYLQGNETQKAVALAQRGIELLQVRGRLFYLRQFLEVIGTYGNRTEKEKRKIRQLIDAIRWMYEEFGVKEQGWTWDIPFNMAELELCGVLIRGRRRVLGYTQEKLAEGICDPVTVSRIERGKVSPKKRRFQSLLDRVGLSGGNYESLIQVERPEQLDLAVRIAVLLSHSKGEEAEPLIAQLEEQMEKNNTTAEQYLLHAKAAALRSQGKIDDRTHNAMQEEALYLTLPRVGPEKLAEWSFTSQEVSIIQALSYSCGADGREEECIRLLRIVQKQYENKPFDLSHYVAGYELTLRSLGDVLGDAGRYEEAIAASKESILTGLRAGRGAVLRLALYDCGWDMEQLWESGKYTKKESLPYVKASYALNLLFGRERASEFIRKHIETYYEPDVKV